MRGLHFVDNESVPATNKDRFHKLGILMTSLTENYENAVYPTRDLCIDESLLSFKGRLSFKQFNAMKRARFGIKMFFLCDATNKYVLRILPYQGKTTNIANRNWIADFGFGGAAVMTLLQEYFNKNYCVTVDNWFMSPTLATKLKQLGTYILGTVQKRRKLMPKMTNKLVKGQIETYSNADILIER